MNKFVLVALLVCICVITVASKKKGEYLYGTSLGKVRVRTVLIIHVKVAEIRDQSREENKLLLQFWLSLPNNTSPNKYFSGHNLKQIK